jgi:F0F1-type ATP synthase assembly protein I
VETGASTVPAWAKLTPESTTAHVEKGAFARPGLSEAQPESTTAANERRIHRADPMTLADPTPDREDSEVENLGRKEPGRIEKEKEKENFWVQATRYSQLAFIFPAALVVGWLAGAGLDRWLHTTWLYLAGILLGIAAGFFELIRSVLRDTR